MYETYKHLSRCATPYYLNKELEELVEDYKATKNTAKRNKIISAIFVKVFPMILKIQKKYYNLTNEQKVDHALWHLIRSIHYYKNDGKTKFSSFFHTHLTNQMKTLLKTQNNFKNAVWQNLVNDKDDVLNWYAKNEADKTMEGSEIYLLNNIKNSIYLSSEEKDFCACVVAGYEKTRSISERMSNPFNKNIQLTEKEEKRELRKTRKIRQAIKDKYTKYGSKIFG